MTDEKLAKIAYEVNVAYCESLGDIVHPAWDELMPFEVAECVDLVKTVREDQMVAPKSLHALWCAGRGKKGWSYGPRLDFKIKTHPLLTDFEKLSKNNQSKGYILKGVVSALTNQEL